MPTWTVLQAQLPAAPRTGAAAVPRALAQPVKTRFVSCRPPAIIAGYGMLSLGRDALTAPLPGSAVCGTEQRRDQQAGTREQERWPQAGRCAGGAGTLGCHVMPPAGQKGSFFSAGPCCCLTIPEITLLGAIC